MNKEAKNEASEFGERSLIPGTVREISEEQIDRDGSDQDEESGRLESLHEQDEQEP